MPIKPENKARYPKNWKQIRARIQARADNKCEQCGVPNHAWVYRDRSGDWYQVGEEGKTYPQPMISMQWARFVGFKVFRIVCTVAHLDHTPENCDESNLRFWCQRCHLRYDHEHHQRNAAETRRKGKAVSDLLAPLTTSEIAHG